MTPEFLFYTDLNKNCMPKLAGNPGNCRQSERYLDKIYKCDRYMRMQVNLRNHNQVGAFFDFDETLLDTESSRLGIKYLWERRLVSRGFILKAFVAGLFIQTPFDYR